MHQSKPKINIFSSGRADNQTKNTGTPRIYESIKCRPRKIDFCKMNKMIFATINTGAIT